MANPYIGQLAPAVGGGLGGLPRRTAVAAAVAAAASLAGTSLLVNPLSVLSSGTATTFINSVALTDNIAIVAATQSSVLYATRIDVSDAGVFTTTRVAINAVASTHISICKLDATRAICVCRNGTTGNLVGYVISLSGSTVAVTAEVVISATVTTGNTNRATVSRLSDTQVLCAYASAASVLEAVVLNVAGTVITPGVVAVGAGILADAYVNSSPLSSAQVICAYIATSISPNVVILTVSGSTATFGSAVVVESSASTYTGIAALTATTAFLVYYSSAATFIRKVVITIAGTVPTIGTPASTAITVSTGLGLIAPASDKAVLFCATNSTSFDISGTAATATREIVESLSNNGHIALTQMKLTRYLGLYAGTNGYMEGMLLALA